MKRILLIAAMAFAFGCNKPVEEVQQNIVMEAMTNGQWKVTSYLMGSMDHTSEFSPYKFQFKENYTVDALKNSAVEKTGSWNADPNARTITSSFSNATTPLTLLNGTWSITRNSWTYVEATQTISGTLHTLRLDKQ
jgi:hypothetical protein